MARYYVDYFFYFVLAPILVAFFSSFLVFLILKDHYILIPVAVAFLVFPYLYLYRPDKKTSASFGVETVDVLIRNAGKIAKVGGVRRVLLSKEVGLQGNALLPFTIRHSSGWVDKALSGGKTWENAYYMMIGHETMHKMYPLKWKKWVVLSPTKKRFVLNAEEAFCDYYGAALASAVMGFSWSDAIAGMKVKVDDVMDGEKTDIFHPSWETRLSVIEGCVFDFDVLLMLAKNAGMRVDSNAKDIDFVYRYWKDLDDKVCGNLFLIRLSDLIKEQHPASSAT